MSTHLISQMQEDQNQNDCKKISSNYMHMLPTEMVESIAMFVETESDFLNWVECYKDSENFGDLSLILDLAKCGIASQVWPSLKVTRQMNENACSQ